MKTRILPFPKAVRAAFVALLLAVMGLPHTFAQNTVPEGALSGLFSVAEDRQVYFSQGNLQYIGSAGTPYWKFADHQWDFLGDNGQGSDSPTADRDLFGWGTSGYNHGATCYQPWSISDLNSDYYAYGSDTYNLNDQTGQADWGYNAISNGCNTENCGWRTLTYEEWSYLFNIRSTASGIRYAKATVNGVCGVILLPDDWSTDYYTLNSTNTSNASFSSNPITTEQWNTFEQHGAVFLPVAGGRYGTSVYYFGSNGYYWTASYYIDDYAWAVVVYDAGLGLHCCDYRSYGRSVRLVRVAQAYSFVIDATPSPVEGGTVSGAGAYEEGAECTLTATASEGYAFVNWTENGEVVSTDAVYTFSVTGNRTLVANFAETEMGPEQSLSLSQGWNWVSYYLETSDELFSSVKNAIAATNSTALIKDAATSIMLQGGSWTENPNNPLSLNNESMYMINLESPVSLTLTAPLTKASSFPITLYPGWNWIGYPSADTIPVEKALSSITPNEGDMIKNQSQSSQYSGTGWLGAVKEMVPGEGYMYYNTGEESQTLVYPEPHPMVEGTVEIPEGMDASDIIITNFIEEVVPDENGEFEIGYNNMLMAESQENGEVVYMSVVSVDYEEMERRRGTSMAPCSLNAKETAITLALYMLPYGLAQSKDDTFLSIKEVLYSLDCVKDLETAIETVVGQYGYLNMDALSAPILGVRDFFMDELFPEGLNVGKKGDAPRVVGTIELPRDGNADLPAPYLPVSRRNGIRIDLENTVYNPSSDTWSLKMTAYSDNGIYVGLNKGNAPGNGLIYYSEEPTHYFIPPMNAGKFVGTFVSWSGIKSYFQDTKRLFTEEGFGFDDMTWDKAKLEDIRLDIGMDDNRLVMLSPNDDTRTAIVNVFYTVLGVAECWVSTEVVQSFLLDLFLDEDFVLMFTNNWDQGTEGLIVIADNLIEKFKDYMVEQTYNIITSTGFEKIEKALQKAISMTQMGAFLVGTAASLNLFESFAFVIDFEFNDSDDTGNLSGGALNGAFTINANGDQVHFSKGNLQYQRSTRTWQFAKNQWDFVGLGNNNTTSYYTGWRDLFGWGTSGYDHGAVCFQPWSSSTSYSDYYAYGDMTCNLNDRSGEADWGYNAIRNGGDTENSGWRTLTQQEWDCLFNTRNTPSGIRYAKAKVNDVYGVILLPDDWSADYYELNNANIDHAVYASNVIDATQWSVLEQHGAVFLPAAGSYVSGVVDSGLLGQYWSASCKEKKYCYHVKFIPNGLSASFSSYRWEGFSVRLVSPVPSYSVEVSVSPAEGGKVTFAGSYQDGKTCTFTAIANTGYVFSHWRENGEEVSSEPVYSFAMTKNRNLVAVFVLEGGNTGSTSEGVLNGAFTINANGDQVNFSQGNLQYQASTNTWRFAENQWDFVGSQNPFLGDPGGTVSGSDNGNISQTYNGWIDLFGWGTSGYHDPNDPYNVNYQPWSTSASIVSEYYNYFGYGPSTNMGSPNLTASSACYDWGVYNAISNGGNQENSGWRTLTHEEWSYLFNTRGTLSGIHYAKAQVNGVNGVILLPDDWNTNYFALNSPDTHNASFSSNTITETQWATLEGHGAVFLPAAGDRNGTGVRNVGSCGQYWSASCSNIWYAWSELFADGQLYTDFDYEYRYNGLSVRLVRLSQSTSSTGFAVNAVANPTEGGVVSGAGVYQAGSICTLTATANNGYTFVNWKTEGGELVSSTPTYSFEVTGSCSLVAYFTTGALNGVFSVGPDTQICFSQGNLQYQASTNTWRFAENQWDFVGAVNPSNGDPGGTVPGSDNGNISQTYNGWIDLFGWGTSGYNHGATCYQPWSTNQENSDYYAYGSYTNNLFDQTGQADWGYNAISNGGNQENSGWRTMTHEEWSYLFNTRSTTSGIRYAKAIVNDVKGVILLPDDWSVDYYSLNNTNTSNAGYSPNIITKTQWATLEEHGAVFLPIAGYRNGTSVYHVHYYGCYWSASYCNSGSAWYVYFSDSPLSTDGNTSRCHGRSVRLVRPAQ